MTYNEKKSLYESIMKEVAKKVKRKINEDFFPGIDIRKEEYKPIKQSDSQQRHIDMHLKKEEVVANCKLIKDLALNDSYADVHINTYFRSFCEMMRVLSLNIDNENMYKDFFELFNDIIEMFDDYGYSI